MYNIFFRPKVGRFGAAPETFDTGSISSLTASATNRFVLPTPYFRVFLEKFSAQAYTPPAGGGTFNATINHISNSGANTKALTVALDLATLTAKVKSNLTKASGLVEGDFLLQPSDLLEVDIVVSSTVTTQPVGLAVTASGTAID